MQRLQFLIFKYSLNVSVCKQCKLKAFTTTLQINLIITDVRNAIIGNLVTKCTFIHKSNIAIVNLLPFVLVLIQVYLPEQNNILFNMLVDFS